MNQILLALGLIAEPLEFLYTDSVVLTGFVYTLLPFMVLPLYTVLEKRDPCRWKPPATSVSANSRPFAASCCHC